ncbi:hypothetical protein [Streptomyces anulatus]|uniref:hypothetical protein n=1 Tax=Streptomyces anulatus TaxID=1892 RepID=UPI00167C0838|nr:hypothetical protein [Streptomyces anulatus]GGY77240.1 hypothetical protein GCM10010342_76230 [Streptomyces anulatus]GGY78398.1 hypothetical protein GCM10010342_77460 [Streptomyces anulatus]
MKQLLALYQYAAGLNRRTLALGIIGSVVALGLVATIVWAPTERATLVVTLVSPVLAAVVAAVFLDWWNRRRV